MVVKNIVILVVIGLFSLGFSSCQQSAERHKDAALNVISCLKEQSKLKLDNFDRRIYIDSIIEVGDFNYKRHSINSKNLLKNSSLEVYPVSDSIELNDYQSIYIELIDDNRYKVYLEIFYDQLAEPWILRLNNNTRKLYELKFMFFGCHCQINEMEEDDWLIQM